MCKFTRTLHLCGHSLYTIHTRCAYAYISPITTTHTCPLILHPTRTLPNEFIAQTINAPFKTCRQDTCLYKAENDPFISPNRKATFFSQQTTESTSIPSSPNTPGIPSFSSPHSLRVTGRSLFEELKPYSADMNFSEAVEADSYSCFTPKLGSIVIGRGCVSGTPNVVYHKYARLSTTPDEKLVKNSPLPKVVAPRLFYRSELQRGKRKYKDYNEEELVSKIRELAVAKRKRVLQLTPMDLGSG